MTKKQRNDKINKIKETLCILGWTEDRYGNFLKIINEKKYRVKFNDTSLRYEVQVIHEATQYSEKSSSWMRVRSAYYKDVEIVDTENGPLIKGLKR